MSRALRQVFWWSVGVHLRATFLQLYRRFASLSIYFLILLEFFIPFMYFVLPLSQCFLYCIFLLFSSLSFLSIAFVILRASWFYDIEYFHIYIWSNYFFHQFSPHVIDSVIISFRGQTFTPFFSFSSSCRRASLSSPAASAFLFTPLGRSGRYPIRVLPIKQTLGPLDCLSRGKNGTLMGIYAAARDI